MPTKEPIFSRQEQAVVYLVSRHWDDIPDLGDKQLTMIRMRFPDASMVQKGKTAGSGHDEAIEFEYALSSFNHFKAADRKKLQPYKALYVVYWEHDMDPDDMRDKIKKKLRFSGRIEFVCLNEFFGPCVETATECRDAGRCHFRGPQPYRNLRRRDCRGLRSPCASAIGIVIPEDLMMDCVRLCCTLCLIENNPEIISPDVLSDDRAKYDQSHDQKYIDKAHRRGKVGWDVGRHVEVMPHYRRPHMTLVWTGRGRALPRIVPRRGSVVHREVVEKVPMGWEG